MLSPLHLHLLTAWFKVDPHHISYRNHLSSSIPEFPNDILNCCDPDRIESSAVLCLPTQGHSLQYAPLSGWNRSAHTLKQSAQFWHKV